MKVSRNLLCAALVSVLFSSNVWATPIQWTVGSGGNGHYYDFVAAANIPWPNARAAALGQFYMGLQGHLVTVTSAAEDAFVFANVQSILQGETWAGGYQVPDGQTVPTAGWTWVNGEGAFPGVDSASPYANWATGEPNDFYDTILVLDTEQFLGLNFNNGWNDEGFLGFIRGYVIEYDPNTINDVDVNPVPEPGTLALLGAGIAGLIVARRRSRRS